MSSNVYVFKSMMLIEALRCYMHKNLFFSQEQARDFWREACILSNLHHPNVVAFYGVVPDGAGGTLATVAEFMANGSLRTALIRKDK